MNKSRRYKEYKSKIDENKIYSLEEFFNFIKENEDLKEKVEGIRASVSLNWRNQKNILKGKITLPNIVSRTKLAVVSDDLPTELAKKIKKIDNVSLLSAEEIKKIVAKKKSSWGFSKLLALPASESKIKPLERIMGPKGAFPNRKNGLLTEGLLDEIEKINRGEKPIKTDKGGNVGLLLGRKDFDLAKLEENFAELKRSVQAMKPVNWKGSFVRNVTLSSTMSPGIKVTF